MTADARSRGHAPVRTKEFVAFNSTWAADFGASASVFRSQLGAVIDAEVDMALKLAGQGVLRDFRALTEQDRLVWEALADLFDDLTEYLDESGSVLTDGPPEEDRLRLIVRLEKARTVLALDRLIGGQS